MKFTTITVIAVALLLLPVFAQAQESKPAGCPFAKMEQQPPPVAGGEGSAAPNKMHEEMMAKHKAMDEKLMQLVEKMNATEGDAKIAAMADVINELVAQRKELQASCHQMMAGCSPPPAPGAAAPAKGCAPGCAMMHKPAKANNAPPPPDAPPPPPPTE